MTHLSKSEQETFDIAFAFGKTLKANDVVAFKGGLGAGKTAFSKGVAAALGVTIPVTSPTFTIINEYHGDIPLYHFDLYRVSDDDSLFNIGYYDYIEGGGVCLLEWSENITFALPKEYYEVTITYGETENTRTINIERVIKQC